jgi:hypothetical protein
VWQHARLALGSCEVARCVYEAARCVYEAVRCGSMHGWPLAVVRQHGVLAWRPGPCLRGHTVWQQARRAQMAVYEVVRCASLLTVVLCLSLHGVCVSVHTWRCTCMACLLCLGCQHCVLACRPVPAFARLDGVAACTTGLCVLRGCAVRVHGFARAWRCVLVCMALRVRGVVC